MSSPRLAASATATGASFPIAIDSVPELASPSPSVSVTAKSSLTAPPEWSTSSDSV